MEPVLVSCRFLLSVVRALIDAVRVRDNLHLDRAEFARAAVAKRLASCLGYVEAYLRRVLLVMALELEPMLEDKRGPMRRPHGRKAKGGVVAPARFVILNERLGAFPEDTLHAIAQRNALRPKPQGRPAPQPIAMARLFQRLDTLAAIAREPLARAKRLAFHLARNREGPIIAPNLNLRPPSYWNTDARATFDALAHDIVTRSRSRPPPLDPPRRCWPTVLRLP
jgi:hypothetical protein